MIGLGLGIPEVAVRGAGASAGANGFFAAATRFSFGNNIALGVPAQKYWIHELQFSSPDYDVRNIKFHYPGFITGSAGNGAEVLVGNNYVVEGCSINIAGGGWQTVHGSVTVTNGVGVLSPGNVVPIPANSTCRVRWAFNVITVGDNLPIGNIILSSNSLLAGNTMVTEISRSSASTSWASQLLNTSLTGSGTQAPGSSWWAPCYMVAQGGDGRPVIGLFGDSIAQGVEDGDSQTPRLCAGFLKKGFDDNTVSQRWAVLDVAIGGTHTQEFALASFWALKIAAITLCGNVPFTHAVTELGAAGAATATFAAFKPLQKTYVSLLKSTFGKPVYQSEFLPHTVASTDACTTLANQNPATDEQDAPTAGIWGSNDDFEATLLDGTLAGYIRSYENVCYDLVSHRANFKVPGFTTTLTSNYIAASSTIVLAASPPIGLDVVLFLASAPTVPVTGATVKSVSGSGPYTVTMDTYINNNTQTASIGDEFRPSYSKGGIHISAAMVTMVIPTITNWKNSLFNYELREDGSLELREDGSFELRE